MRFWDIVMTAATQGGGAAPGPVELFPDPDLEDVADGTNGWSFSNPEIFGPAGGTGPGIGLIIPGEDEYGRLTGADDTAIRAAVANSSTKTVAITISSFSVAGSIFIDMKDGTPVEYVVAGNGVISHSVTAGTENSADQGFTITAGPEAMVFDITHISVMTP